MVGEIDNFWNDMPIDPKKLEIDYENLNGIAIYIVLKSGVPLLLIDILFVENFVSKTILTTNRSFHMTVLHSALAFIEENLPSYYDSKDKTNPLNENLTPFFNLEANISLSPKSVGP